MGIAVEETTRCCAQPDELPERLLFLQASIVIWFFFNNTRYLFPKPRRIRPARCTYVDHDLSENNPECFKRALRVTPVQFRTILELIEDHPVFQDKNRRPQRHVSFQLKTALHRFGHEGSLSGHSELASKLNISIGSHQLCENSAVFAIREVSSMAD